MKSTDWLTFVPILVTGLSAILAALLNTHEKDDEGAKNKLRRKLNVVGWVAIGLTCVATLVGIVISANRMTGEATARTERDKEKQRAAEMAAQLLTANGKLEEQGVVLQNQSSALDQQSSFIREEANRAISRAHEASKQLNRANDRVLTQERTGTELLRKQQVASETEIRKVQTESATQIQRVQTESASKIQEQQNHHQDELRFQQDLLMASLLGQQSERPQAKLILNTTLTIDDPDDQAFLESFSRIGGGALASFLFEDSYAEAQKSKYPMQFEVTFATLKATVPNPFEETVPYGWTARILTGNTPESEVALAFGGPYALVAPKPELDLILRESSKRLFLSLHSRLRHPISSALLYQGLKAGQVVAELGLSIQGLKDAEVNALIERCKRVLIGGQEWTLINGKSGICAVASLDKPSIELEPKSQSVKVTWRINEENQLTPCPANLFLDLSELDK